MFLAGPYDLKEAPLIREMYLGRDVLLYGKSADIPYDFEADNFQSLLDRIPSNQSIDFLLFVCPEFFGVPVGIERAPFPVIGVSSDWSINLEALVKIAPFFSYLVVDRPGFNTFQDFGFQNATYVPLYGYSPTLYQWMPEIKKSYDITMIGNLNDVVHDKRAFYLKRLAMLSSQYNITFVSGIYGKDYTRLLNASKITFNHSIRGEMNMRCYEALACGSLLFLEETNVEAKLYLQDKVHCIYYNEQNLEELVHYYLSHDDERDTISKNGRIFVQDHSYARQIDRLLKRIEEVKEGRLLRTPPQAAQWSEGQKAHARYFHSLHTSEISRCEPARQAMLLLSPDEPCYNFLAGYLALQYSDAAPTSERKRYWEQAVECFNQAVQRQPFFPPLYFNFGKALLKLNRHKEAIEKLWIGVALSKTWDSTHEEFGSLLYPIDYDAWHVEKERQFKDKKNLGGLLTARCFDALGDAAMATGNFNGAINFYQQALESKMNESEISKKLGDAFEKIDDQQGRIQAYEHALEKRPFYIEVWKILPRLYLAAGEKNKLQDFSKEIVKLINAFPGLTSLKSEFEDWLDLAKTA